MAQGVQKNSAQQAEIIFFGHKNISSKHKSTFEITKDGYLTKNGDCIIGIKGRFSKAELKAILTAKKRVSISFYIPKTAMRTTIGPIAAKQKQGLKRAVENYNSWLLVDKAIAYSSESFCSRHELVVRKSSYKDKRTLAIRSNKAASGLSKRLIAYLKKGGIAKAVIRKLKLKAVLFDFDDTLEVWQGVNSYAEMEIAKAAEQAIGISRREFYNSFFAVKKGFEKKAITPRDYNRLVWVKETLKKFGVADNILAKKLEGIYWQYVNSKARLFPNTIKALELARSLGLKLAIVTDSDGRREIKEQRINRLNIKGYFDAIISSDYTGKNKPDKLNYELVMKKLSVRPENCLMVGDKAFVDLSTAKSLGMATALTKEKLSYIKNKELREHYDEGNGSGYADFVINDIIELKDILRKLV